MRSSENATISALSFSISTRQASAVPTSAMAAETAHGRSARRAIAACVCGRPGGDRIDQIGVHQQRRMLEHPARDLRLVGGEPEDHRRRRLVAERQRPRQRLAHQRRRIVEQHDQRAFGRGAIVGRQIGIEIGARHARWLPRHARRRPPYGASGGIDERSCLDRSHDEVPQRRHGMSAIVRRRCLIKRSP